MQEKNHIIIFAKQPIAGSVKTRLIATLGADAAANLSTKLCQHTINIAVKAGYPIHLFCHPNSQYPLFLENQKRYALHLHQQQGDDLGQRLAHAFRKVFTKADRVIAIGSDCPVLEVEYLHEAIDALENKAEVVLGPAEDGGYVLIGMQHFYPELFKKIPWSTDKVLQVTQERIQSQKLSSVQLSTLWDVDVESDLIRLKELK